MRDSGERQRNRRNASPENFVSATNAGRPEISSTITAQGEKCTSRDGITRQRDRVLRPGPNVRITSAQRAARSFAACADELVVELAVLEALQLERQRLLEDHDVDALAELRAQQRLALREIPRCVAAIAVTMSASRATNCNTGRYATVPASPWMRMAETTLSTMSEPTYATPAGNAPASTVRIARASGEPAVGGPHELYGAPAITEHPEKPCASAGAWVFA